MEEDQPRLEACYFMSGDRASTERYQRMARVLEFSAQLHCPGWSINVREIGRSPYVSALSNVSHRDNTVKLVYWTQLVLSAADGDRLVLLDADMAVLQALDPVWDIAFDLAYTVRPEGCRYPFNGGVVAVRVSAGVRAFMSAWLREDLRMLTDPKHHRDPRAKYGGINQAAFGYLLDTWPGHGLAIAQLPCAEWNCEDSGWETFDPSVTRILHVKSGLRSVALATESTVPRAPDLLPMARIWRSLERAAKAQAVAS